MIHVTVDFGDPFAVRFFKHILITHRRTQSVRIRSYSGPDFPATGVNTERYKVSLGIMSKCGKMRTRISPNTGTYYAVTKIKSKYQTNIRKYTQNELSLLTNIIYVVVFLFRMFTSKFLTFYYIFSAGLSLALGITKCNSWLVCLQKVIINE